MRCSPLLLASLAAAALPAVAAACPPGSAIEVSTDDAPATSAVCMTKVDFSRTTRTIGASYVLGASGATRTAIDSTASAFAGLELGFATQFGADPATPSYEIEGTGGVSLHRTEGNVRATGVATRGTLRLGPARVRAANIDDGRSNLAAFPLTLELAHAGELAAQPRLAARPELARALYGRERVELATRLLRVEGAGAKADTTAPGLTAPQEPSSWALDVIPLYTGLDVAMQGATRFETTVGGALLGVTEHTTGIKADVFRLDHTWIHRTAAEPASIATLWMLRVDGVLPATGGRYYLGWGVVAAMPDRDLFAERLDPEEQGEIQIGGAGWFSSRRWGGFGAQYKREPFVTMDGTAALEDRISGEVYLRNRLGLVARAFGARTTRLTAMELRHDMTAGVEVEATYTHAGFASRLGLELGRTFYTALDDAMPDATGFVAGLGLTIQRAGGRTWSR